MKAPFDALARLLATPGGLRAARLLQAAGWLNAPAAEPAEPRPRARAPEPISIWEPRRIDGELAFVRPEPLPLGDHYALTRILSPTVPLATRRVPSSSSERLRPPGKCCSKWSVSLASIA